MVKLLIGLNYKKISGFSLEIQKDIREIHQRTQWMQDQDKWKTL